MFQSVTFACFNLAQKETPGPNERNLISMAMEGRGTTQADFYLYINFFYDRGGLEEIALKR